VSIPSLNDNVHFDGCPNCGFSYRQSASKLLVSAPSTDVQQLKAKIAALADEVFQMSLLHPSEQSFSGIVDRMRQLSAV